MSLFQDFQSISLEEWKNKIINDIKGKDYQDTLVWETEEGFNVQPVYNKESLIDNKSKEYLLNKTSSEWEIREQIEVTDIDKANRKAIKALQGGANSLQFNGNISSFEDMKALLNEIMIEIIHIHFYNSNAIQTADFLNQIIKERNLNKSEIKASVSYDYLGELLISGAWHKNEQTDFDTVYQFIKNSPFSNITINGHYYSNAGANNSQEIAYAFSQAVEYIDQLTERGMTAEDVISKIDFNFGINSNYFFEITKIRAAKIVWEMIAESYDVCISKTNIHCQTSCYNLATQDSYTNLLRTTTEAMSAIIGGCNSLSLTPFNDIYESSSDFSSRIARNIQIILKEESFLDKVNDVAKGSYYIETLTDEMVEQTLKLFKEIEIKGGFLTNIKNRNIQTTVKTTNKTKLKKYQEGKKTLLGVNKYPNKMEKEKHQFIQTQKIRGNEVEILEQVNISEKIKNQLPLMPNNYEVIKSVPFDYGLIELRSDNIITFEPVDGFSTFTIPQLKVMLEILLDISEGIPRPYFSDNRNLKSLGTEERVYINEHMHKFTSAFAMTENSAITRFITHTFMQLNRPPFPVKMFKTKDEAILWLRTFNN